ncbi:MAG: bifunctional [glutamine synthetase] adenylyltransferase/[glutamine synthetase]-adenylyl-L-tyrosine phosphorylase [Microlunatus sp.]
MSRIETTQGVLARRGFVDPAAAVRILGTWDDAQEQLLDLVTEAADPDLALSSLDRIGGVVPDLLPRLTDSPDLARHLITLLGASEYIGRHLLAHPEHLDWLDGDVQPLAADAIRAELLRSVGADPEAPLPLATDLVGDGLRLAYRGHLMRIAAWDVCDPEPIEVMPRVADALSDLADATLEAALAISRAKVGEKGLKTRLAVVGLGKCGAQELNYVSDVDVLFVAEPMLDADGTPMISGEQAVSTATRMAAELTRICSAYTAAGTIWEVDSALRPEGKAGQLVRSLSSHRTYYQRWAKTWEFQAMLKARPSAGDLQLAQDFVDMVSPMVWRAAERENFVADTQAMRKRVVAHIPARDAGREIKLGEGGLRDVEFSVQLLQLVHGRVDERLRDRATLAALKALTDNGYVGREDGKLFRLAYQFMRTLEHRVQLYHLRRTHLMPDNEADLRRLGRSLGYQRPAEQVVSTWKHACQRVRRLHERLFYSPLLDAVARIPSKDLRLTEQSALDRLKGLGYADPQAALRHIAALSQGVTRQTEIQRQLLPAMLGWFAAAPNPDHGLLAFRQVSDTLGSTPWYLRALRDEGMMAERLARILASSRYAVALLQRAPQTMQMLADDAELVPKSEADLRAEMLAAARRSEEPIPAVESIRAIRRRELFRIAASDVLGISDVLTVGDGLSELASATVHATLEVARRASGADQVPEIAVIGMGRWGGRELSYASDADAMFVMADPGSTDQDWTKIAGSVISEMRRLLTRPSVDPPLSIDADLRPEGKGGALIRTLSAYRNYYSRWSSTWEMQALVRADAMAGSPDLGRELMALIDQKRWPAGGLSTAQVHEIRRLKARVDAERLPRGADPAKHTKLGPGGLADVEWTVQLLQLQHAHAVPELRTSRTIEALRAARRAELIDPQDAGHLEAAWLLASKIRNQIMLVRGRGSDSLPSDTRELAALAELMGYKSGESSHLLADYRRVTRRAHAVVDRVFWGVEDGDRRVR